MVKCLPFVVRGAITSGGSAPRDVRPLSQSSMLEVKATLSIERMRNSELKLTARMAGGQPKLIDRFNRHHKEHCVESGVTEKPSPARESTAADRPPSDELATRALAD
jgi:hypothetical protein